MAFVFSPQELAHVDALIANEFGEAGKMECYTNNAQHDAQLKRNTHLFGTPTKVITNEDGCIERTWIMRKRNKHYTVYILTEGSSSLCGGQLTFWL